MYPDGYARHTPVLAGDLVIRAMSIDVALLPFIGDAITELAESYQWTDVGDSVDTITQEIQDTITSWYDPMIIGQISFFLGNIPSFWLPLDGSTYDQADYPELSQLLDGVFKNDVAGTFTLPDIRDRFLVVSDNAYSLGDTGGLSTVALTISELPAHDHTYVNPVANVDLEAPGAPDILAAGVGPGSTTGTTGSGDSHENRPPYFAIKAGIFSGRS